jgi:hypothetical protein
MAALAVNVCEYARLEEKPCVGVECPDSRFELSVAIAAPSSINALGLSIETVMVTSLPLPVWLRAMC